MPGHISLSTRKRGSGNVAGLGGLEPPTLSLGNSCSIHLSYNPAPEHRCYGSVRAVSMKAKDAVGNERSQQCPGLSRSKAPPPRRRNQKRKVESEELLRISRDWPTAGHSSRITTRFSLFRIVPHSGTAGRKVTSTNAHNAGIYFA